MQAVSLNPDGDDAVPSSRLLFPFTRSILWNQKPQGPPVRIVADCLLDSTIEFDPSAVADLQCQLLVNKRAFDFRLAQTVKGGGGTGDGCLLSGVAEATPSFQSALREFLGGLVVEFRLERGKIRFRVSRGGRFLESGARDLSVGPHEVVSRVFPRFSSCPSPSATVFLGGDGEASHSSCSSFSTLELLESEAEWFLEEADRHLGQRAAGGVHSPFLSPASVLVPLVLCGPPAWASSDADPNSRNAHGKAADASWWNSYGGTEGAAVQAKVFLGTHRLCLTCTPILPLPVSRSHGLHATLAGARLRLHREGGVIDTSSALEEGQWGFLTLDRTRKVVCLTAGELEVFRPPLVGVWVVTGRKEEDVFREGDEREGRGLGEEEGGALIEGPGGLELDGDRRGGKGKRGASIPGGDEKRALVWAACLHFVHDETAGEKLCAPGSAGDKFLLAEVLALPSTASEAGRSNNGASREADRRGQREKENFPHMPLGSCAFWEVQFAEGEFLILESEEKTLRARGEATAGTHADCVYTGAKGHGDEAGLTTPNGDINRLRLTTKSLSSLCVTPEVPFIQYPHHSGDLQGGPQGCLSGVSGDTEKGPSPSLPLGRGGGGEPGPAGRESSLSKMTPETNPEAQSQALPRRAPSPSRASPSMLSSDVQKSREDGRGIRKPGRLLDEEAAKMPPLPSMSPAVPPPPFSKFPSSRSLSADDVHCTETTPVTSHITPGVSSQSPSVSFHAPHPEAPFPTSLLPPIEEEQDSATSAGTPESDKEGKKTEEEEGRQRETADPPPCQERGAPAQVDRPSGKPAEPPEESQSQSLHHSQESHGQSPSLSQSSQKAPLSVAQKSERSVRDQSVQAEDNRGDSAIALRPGMPLQSPGELMEADRSFLLNLLAQQGEEKAQLLSLVSSLVASLQQQHHSAEHPYTHPFPAHSLQSHPAAPLHLHPNTQDSPEHPLHRLTAPPPQPVPSQQKDLCHPTQPAIRQPNTVPPCIAAHSSSLSVGLNENFPTSSPVSDAFQGTAGHRLEPGERCSISESAQSRKPGCAPLDGDGGHVREPMGEERQQRQPLQLSSSSNQCSLRRQETGGKEKTDAVEGSVCLPNVSPRDSFPSLSPYGHPRNSLSFSLPSSSSHLPVHFSSHLQKEKENLEHAPSNSRPEYDPLHLQSLSLSSILNEGEEGEGEEENRRSPTALSLSPLSLHSPFASRERDREGGRVSSQKSQGRQTELQSQPWVQGREGGRDSRPTGVSVSQQQVCTRRDPLSFSVHTAPRGSAEGRGKLQKESVHYRRREGGGAVDLSSALTLSSLSFGSLSGLEAAEKENLMASVSSSVQQLCAKLKGMEEFQERSRRRKAQ